MKKYKITENKNDFICFLNIIKLYFRIELARDLDFRASLRRDEAREQAERHRLEMEMMLDRVTQIPTLFERHSQVGINYLDPI